jgi:hypothetical protein
VPYAASIEYIQTGASMPYAASDQYNQYWSDALCGEMINVNQNGDLQKSEVSDLWSCHSCDRKKDCAFPIWEPLPDSNKKQMPPNSSQQKKSRTYINDPYKGERIYMRS